MLFCFCSHLPTYPLFHLLLSFSRPFGLGIFPLQAASPGLSCYHKLDPVSGMLQLESKKIGRERGQGIPPPPIQGCVPPRPQSCWQPSCASPVLPALVIVLPLSLQPECGNSILQLLFPWFSTSLVCSLHLVHTCPPFLKISSKHTFNYLPTLLDGILPLKSHKLNHLR